MGINLQLYSFGMGNPMTVTEKIKAAAELGFSGVEFARDYVGVPAEDVKKALDDANVTADSAHVSLEFMEEDIPYLAKLGVKYVFCPMAQFNSPEEAQALAADLNRFGKMAAEYGIKVGYHNHTDEYFEVDGKFLYQYLIDACDPQYTAFEIDCGWCSASGTDPVAFINANKGKIAAIHIKENSDVIGAQKPLSRSDRNPMHDLKKDENGNFIIPEAFQKMMEERDRLNVAQGTGIVDWKAIKAAADAQFDNVVYVVEREADYGGKSRIDCLKEDIAWLKANFT